MTYEELQKVKYRSFESENPNWIAGQRRVIEEWVLPHINKTDWILDCACGDGSGLNIFVKWGHYNVMGMDFEPEKVRIARKVHSVLEHDFHIPFPNWNLLDVIYSSHSLEHAHDPVRVLNNFHAMLKPGSLLFLVLPFPDTGPADAHCGKEVLGTDGENTERLNMVLAGCGFDVREQKLDSRREPEVWIRAKRL